MTNKKKLEILEYIMFNENHTKEEKRILYLRLKELACCIKEGNKKHISNGYRNLANYKNYL